MVWKKQIMNPNFTGGSLPPPARSILAWCCLLFSTRVKQLRKLQNSVNSAFCLCAILRCAEMCAFYHTHLLSHSSLKSCSEQHFCCKLLLYFYPVASVLDSVHDTLRYKCWFHYWYLYYTLARNGIKVAQLIVYIPPPEPFRVYLFCLRNLYALCVLQCISILS